MLSITTKSPYALRALTELARMGAEAPVPIGELARRREIPVQFLEQLFAVLRRAGLLKSQRGVKGGYSFARDPSEITVLELVELLDGPLGNGAEGIFADAAAAARAVLARRRRSPTSSSARTARPARACTTSNGGAVRSRHSGSRAEGVHALSHPCWGWRVPVGTSVLGVRGVSCGTAACHPPPHAPCRSMSVIEAASAQQTDAERLAELEVVIGAAWTRTCGSGGPWRRSGPAGCTW